MRGDFGCAEHNIDRWEVRRDELSRPPHDSSGLACRVGDDEQVNVAAGTVALAQTSIEAVAGHLGHGRGGRDGGAGRVSRVRSARALS